MKRISSLCVGIERLFFSSFLSAVAIAVSCNKLSLLVSFFLLLFVQYGTPPSNSICLANGSQLDLLTDSVGFSILLLTLYLPCTGVRLISFGRT